MIQAALPFDKRWSQRQERWRHPTGRDRLDPTEYGVDVIDEAAAKALVREHHYSGSFPAARLSVGLWRKTGVQTSRLVGVAVFSVPMQQASIPRYAGVPADVGVELGRFVCLEEVAFNGETYFLRRAFAQLRTEKPEVAAVLSYADPMERHTLGGELTKASHVGQIYQAHNACFAGRARPRWVWLDRNGQVVSERALSKIRGQESGHGYAERQLIAAGAPPRLFGEEPTAWVERVLDGRNFRRVRSPGNLVYCFGLTRSVKASIAAANDGGLPYPRIKPSTSCCTITSSG